MKINGCGKREYRAIVIGDACNLTGPEHENLSDDEMWAEAEQECKRANLDLDCLEDASIEIFTEP
jgi:hypothetical protein